MPNGWAIIKLPLMTLICDPAIGVLLSPIEKRAVISSWSCPAACLAISRLCVSVILIPL